MNIAKKFAAGAVVLSVAFAMVFSASAVTLTMDMLLALGLTEAQAAAILAATGGSSSSGTSSYTHTVTLRRGSMGSQVSAAQSCFLNSKGFTAGIADGNFGAGTEMAVKSFQASKGLTADGVVGPTTGGALSTACMGSSSSSGGSSSSGSTGGDVDLEDFIIEGGMEASLDDFDAKDGDDSDVMEGDSGKEIARFEMTWDDSDTLLERVDFAFIGQDANDEFDPDGVFEDITLMINGDEVDTVDGSDSDNWDDDNYGDQDDFGYTSTDSTWSLRFSGINEILEEGDETVITLEADFASSVDGADDGESWDIYIPADGLRVTDTSGTTNYAGADDDSATVTVDGEGADNAFTIRQGDDNPDAMTLEADDTGRTEITVLQFEIEADEDGEDLQINEINVQADTTDGAVATNYAGVVYETTLVIDGEEYDVDTVTSTSGTTGCDTSAAYTESADDPCLTWNFDRNELVIGSGDTVNAELILDVKALDGVNYGAGQVVSADVAAADFEVEGDSSKEDVTDLNGSVTGENQTLYTEGISVTAGDMTYEDVEFDGDTVRVIYTVDLEVTAFGDTFYIPAGVTRDDASATVGLNHVLETSAGATTLDSANVVESTGALSSTADVVSSYWEVNEGDTETITATISVVQGASPADGFYRAQLTELRYDTDQSGTPSEYTLVPASDFETALRELTA